MSVQTSTLFETAQLASGDTTAYTSTGLRTIIDKATGYGFAAGDITIRLVPAGQSSGNSYILEKKTFAVGESYTWPGIVGHTLEAGDFIVVTASAAASLNLRLSGRKVT